MLSLLFPRACPICGEVINNDDEFICQECFQRLPRTEQCSYRGNLTEGLFLSVPHFQRGAAFLFFDKGEPTQRIIHEMKYKDQPKLGYVLAKEAAKDFMQSDFFDGIDVIIPVPLHPKRLKDRGYNQSEWIAKGLTEMTGIPMDTEHLIRVRNNPQQALMDSNKREENVKEAFEVKYPQELYHKHILLVDDVVTTGSTLKACMSALKVARGAQFSVFALGKAR